ncbi:hypothetical protein BH10BAC3_BH10BAC3_30760 [soil metagenome]
MIKRAFIIVFLLTYYIVCNAQLKANFSIDKASGCSPLEVHFTNNTTGATAGVSYSWNFGNGNSSALADPGATYSAEKSYTVTLTANDGGITSSISKTITVYKKPVVDFSASPLRGCEPLNVKFTSNVAAGDGTITNYLWDFGDGKTLEGDSIGKTAHIYTVPQKPPLSLTVTNSFGCYTSINKNSLVEVLARVTASFTASKTILCSPGQVKFTNSSTGGGTLSYLWNFGDGTTSTLLSPIHNYTSSGSFSVKLAVKNDAGCFNETKPLVINVANFKADFATPVTTCNNQLLTFSNKSTRPYDSIRWEINGAPVLYSISNGNMSSRITDTGTYTIKLVAYYKACSDSVIKTIKVSEPPQINGFLVARDNPCGLPTTFTFSDTSLDGSKWVWRYEDNKTILGITKTATHTYTTAGTDKIGLTVTSAEGCSRSIIKTISYNQTNVGIIIKNSTSPGLSPNRGCTGLGVTFSTTPVNEVVSFKWSFGDGTFSNRPEPLHLYNKYGSYQVSLDYVTKTGCAGRVNYDSIFITDIQPSSFNVSPGTQICGNSKVTFTPTVSLPNRDYIWLINGKEALYSLTPAPFEHHFQQAGVYSISLVVKAGLCRDTVTKVDYITVFPPFPEIKSAINTCSGTRGLVSFKDTTRQSESWAWEFGDGKSLSYGSFIPALSHTYANTGTYKVKLTATNGACTVADSLYVNVLLKQKSLLASAVTQVCTSDSPVISLSNFEVNPITDSSQPYRISKLQFGDLTTSNAVINTGSWSTMFTGAISGLETGKQDLRIITTSNYFGCEDTSNFIKLKISGPKAGFSFNTFTCFNEPLVLKNLSSAAPGSPIVKWEWMFGDSTVKVANNGNTVTHQYSQPGIYQLGLQVTDGNGCTIRTPADSAHMISLTGPAADFEASVYDVFVNTTVNFSNTSTFFDNSELKWRFHDGSVSTDNDTYFYYDTEGDYKVKLTTKNLLSGCNDTMQKIIHVKRVQSIFSYEITYTNSNNCPPVIVALQSNSLNAARVSWTFGDGGEAGNQKNVTHVYTEAGIYKIVHYSYDSTGRKDSSSQLIEVKGPYAIITADTLFACSALQVKLTAQPINAVSFKWDFGDGTISATTDTFATYLYKFPGVYTPALILTDSIGCNATSQLNNKIIIDSLSLSVGVSPNRLICDSAQVTFTPVVNSFSLTNVQTPLQYLWTSDMHQNQVFYTKNAAWNFNEKGIHDVHLKVTSEYGCRVDVLEQVDIKQGVIAGIKGEAIACRGDSIRFRGTAIPDTGYIEWRWQLANNTFSSQQVPVPIVYPAAGNLAISLVVNNEFCSDTAYYSLNVFVPPVLALAASKPYVCQGDTALINISASGGSSIQWSPAVASTYNAGYSAIIKPVATVFYTATITDSVGCKAIDSIKMDVISPFKMEVKNPLTTCIGSVIQFYASGAASYYWLGEGLNSTAENPYIIPSESAVYQVVGFDAYNCFTDSAEITLTVGNIPAVNAGTDQKVIAGFETTLVSISSPDVVKWSWEPTKYLSCTNCATTVSKPEANIEYVVTATTAIGCTAKDTVRLEMLCGSNLIHIPSAFTPNGDNLNDRFVVHGSGITIKRLAIFDRWGKVVFERKEVNSFDRNSNWDGACNGVPMASGGYVYVMEAVCEKGEPFTFKGIVTLIR